MPTWRSKHSIASARSGLAPRNKSVTVAQSRRRGCSVFTLLAGIVTPVAVPPEVKRAAAIRIVDPIGRWSSNNRDTWQAVVISDLPGPMGGVSLRASTGARISVTNDGIVIDNGQGAFTGVMV
jgi:hypothetical protein